MTDRTFRTKVVHAFDRDVAVVLQDANGPCPLLAIVNVLVLSGRLELRPVCGRVEQAVLLSQVAAVALESGYGRAGAEESADRAHNLADVVACLPLLATGLDVNVRFADAESYEATAQTAVFDALSVRLLHGFMAQDAPAPSFNQVLERAQTSEVAAVREEAGAFLRRSASSLTEAGLAALARTLDGTLGVILLGTHFAAATARGGVVYALVTDVGYAGLSALVWERLAVSGDTVIFDDRFREYTGDAALCRRLQEEADAAAAASLSAQLAGGGVVVGGGGYNGHTLLDHGGGDDYGLQLAPGLWSPGGGLHAAAARRDAAAARAALAAGAPVDGRDGGGRTALAVAAAAGSADVVGLLLARGASADATDAAGATPLHAAAAGGHAVVVRALLAAGAHPGAADKDGVTPRKAASTADVRELLAKPLGSFAPPPPPPRPARPPAKAAAKPPPPLPPPPPRAPPPPARRAPPRRPAAAPARHPVGCGAHVSYDPPPPDPPGPAGGGAHVSESPVRRPRGPLQWLRHALSG